ncbi:MAG: hypothetical protein GY810_02715, partial [Aureispira sp.]|nr:hypothetical protein [Aureispira sp.]
MKQFLLRLLSPLFLLIAFNGYSQIVLTPTDTTNETCPGLCDGTFTVSVTGGTPPYDFTLFGDPSGIRTVTNINSTTFTYTNLCANTYIVLVQDDLGQNTLIPAFGQVEAADPFDITSSITNETCAGDADAVIDLTINSTDFPYTFSWDNGATSEDLNSITAGNYTVTVTDGRGCTFNDNYNVISQSTINVDFSVIGNNCINAPILITDQSTGSTAGATYTWDFGSGATPTTANSSGSHLVNYNSGGSKDIKLTVDNGTCNADTTKTIVINPPPTLSTSGDVSICEGESTNLSTTAPNAVSYSWAPNDGTLSDITLANPVADPTTTTNYTVTITDANGCTNTESLTVTVNPLPTITLAPNFDLCLGDSLQFNPTVTGATAFSWTPTDGTLSATNIQNPFAKPIINTQYTLTATSADNCSIDASTDVNINSLPIVSGLTVTPTICEGETATLIGVGSGVTFTWTPVTTLTPTTGPAVIASPIATTTYAVTGTDINNCSNTADVTVTVNPRPNVSITGDNDICVGESTELTASGANTYSWSPTTSLDNPNNDVVNANPTADITYTVTGTDANNCSNTADVTVTVNPIPNISITGDNDICLGESTELTASGANTYSWSPTTSLDNPNNDVVNANPTADITYTVTGTDANNCSNTADVT